MSHNALNGPIRIKLAAQCLLSSTFRPAYFRKRGGGLKISIDSFLYRKGNACTTYHETKVWTVAADDRYLPETKQTDC